MLLSRWPKPLTFAENNSKVILDLCGGTGSWSQPYSKIGYDVRIVTLPDYNIEKWQKYPNLIKLIRENKIHGILAAPPCTHFSFARNDKTAKIPRDIRSGFKTVHACLEIIWECSFDFYKISENSLKFWALENPDGYLKRFLGKPSLVFHPYYYGDPYTKETLIWGMFNEPKKNVVKPRDFEHPTTKGAKDFVSCVEYFQDLKQIPDGYLEKTNYSKRSTLRSMTPQGFAKAFFEANP